jgi:hypothetical protein
MIKKILLVLTITTGFAACQNEPSVSPKATIDGMFTVMKNGDIDGMKRFISRADLANFETIEKIGNTADSGMVKTIKEKITSKLREELKTVSYTLKNEKIDGDNATIEAEVTKEGKKDSHTFELVKEDDGWKIALSKPGNEMFNSMKGNMGPDKGDFQKDLEKLQHMNPDSLKMLLNKASQVMDSLKKPRE